MMFSDTDNDLSEATRALHTRQEELKKLANLRQFQRSLYALSPECEATNRSVHVQIFGLDLNGRSHEGANSFPMTTALYNEMILLAEEQIRELQARLAQPVSTTIRSSV